MKTVLLLVFLLVVSVGSFYATLYFLPANKEVDMREKLGEEVASVHYWLEKLRDCQKSNAGSCSSIGSQLILNIREAKGDKLYTNEKGLFSIFLLENNLVYLKEKCSPSDTKIDMFPVNYYPIDKNKVPAARRGRGLNYLNKVVYFKKNGLRVENTCLLISVLELGGSDIEKLTTGQFQPKKGWKWNVDWKLSAG